MAVCHGPGAVLVIRCQWLCGCSILQDDGRMGDRGLKRELKERLKISLACSSGKVSRGLNL